jgi:hypothetical protein
MQMAMIFFLITTSYERVVAGWRFTPWEEMIDDNLIYSAALKAFSTCILVRIRSEIGKGREKYAG